MRIGFGLFDQLEWPEKKDYRTMLNEKFEVVALVDKLECFDTFFSTERHFTRLSANLSQSVLISSLAQITSRIRFGALVYVLPTRNPLMLAEEITMLDHITSGRLDMGFGSGISELELELFGLDAAKARMVSKEAFAMLLRYFTTESDTFTFNGKFFRYSNIPRLVKPYQKPHPPIWVPSRNLETMKWLGEHGFNTAWIFDTYDKIRSAFDNYWKNFNAVDKIPKVGLVRHLFVARSDEQALRKVRPALVNYGRDERFLFKPSVKSYAKKRTGYQPFDLFSFEDPDYIIGHDIAIAGSPKTVSKKIKRAVSLTRANYFMPYMDFGSIEHEDVMSSIELFSEEVYPEFAD